MKQSDTDGGVRLDKWLWAARFYKTRSLAAEAVAGGKVEVNGRAVKRSRVLEVGDRIRIRQLPFEHQIVVRLLSERRGPAVEAATLYEETPASREARERLAAHIRAERQVYTPAKGRPTKKDRRDLARLKDDFDPS
jgi:ribosome-associated heat shock protein Hsp15